MSAVKRDRARVLSRIRPPAVSLPLVLILLVGLGCGGEEGYRVLQVGDAAPAYGARALDGDSVDLASLRGRPALVNLWATWCVPCRQEMPELQELHERYQDRLHVLGVSIDEPGADRQVRDFVEEAGVAFPILLDPEGRFVRRFTTIGVPETFLIDAEGVVRHRWVGQFAPLAPENLAIVDQALAR